MSRLRLLSAVLLALLPWAAPVGGDAIPTGLGVNIHFTHPLPGEMEMLAASGVKWVRMDLSWAHTEKERGVYDFSAYEHLLGELERQGLRALLILDYANPLYDDDQSPRTEAGREAFARWAVAAAEKFQGRGILWEVYNEPNLAPFWRPKPNTRDYVLLAKAVGEAFALNVPGETVVGPASSGIPMGFLEELFQAGLLRTFDAVTVHPYRTKPPETVEGEYRQLRLLIGRYAPAGKRVPVLSGEWGYSAAWPGFNAEKQGKYLARQWLVNLANDIPLSIWYDWRNDGTDAKEPEHHFGTVMHAHQEGEGSAFEPKPAYRAMRTLTGELEGYSFNKRLATGSEEDWVLLFGGERGQKLVAWTTAEASREVVVPASAGAFAATSHVGEALAERMADEAGLTVRLTDAPVYLTPKAENAVLAEVAGWPRLPLEVALAGPAEVRVQGRPVRVDRSGRVVPVRVERQFGGQTAAQRTVVLATNPLRVEAMGRLADGLRVRVENPTGEPTEGKLALVYVPPFSGRIESSMGLPAQVVPLVLHGGQTEEQLVVPWFEGRGVPGALFRLEVMDAGEELLLQAEPTRHEPVGLGEGLALSADGDAQVGSRQTMKFVEAEGLAGRPRGVAIRYAFEPGWKFATLRLTEEGPRKVEGRPRALAMWVKGDGSGNALRMRFVDAAGQTHQADGPMLTWEGWRWVEFPMDKSNGTSWGGPADGVIHYPVELDTLALVDSANRQATEGEVVISSPVLVYGAEGDDRQ